MKKALILCLAVLAANSFAQSFTAVDAPQYYGFQELTEAIDANFALVKAASFKPASGAGVLTITGNETNDASLVLDADDGDDNADTWTIKSETADNDLSFFNHTTERAKLTSAGALTVGALSTGTGEATIDGKYAVVGGDATTALMVLKGSITSGTNATETVTFGTVFGAAPVVMCTYTEDPGDVRPIFVTSVTASNFVANITADKNFGYIAVGTRP